jgi:hypothetical protein
MEEQKGECKGRFFSKLGDVSWENAKGRIYTNIYRPDFLCLEIPFPPGKTEKKNCSTLATLETLSS